jgi:hypothetical protein
MGHQSAEKLGIFSIVKIFQNPSCYILGKINENYNNFFFFGYHDALKIYGWHQSPKLCTKMTRFPPSEGVSEITFGSICKLMRVPQSKKYRRPKFRHAF